MPNHYDMEQNISDKSYCTVEHFCELVDAVGDDMKGGRNAGATKEQEASNTRRRKKKQNEYPFNLDFLRSGRNVPRFSAMISKSTVGIAMNESTT